MDRYKMPEIIRNYFSNSQYQVPKPEYSYASRLLYEPSSYSRKSLETEKYLLEEILLPSRATYRSLADEVFGQQALKERISLKQFTKLLEERYQIHMKLLADIKHRNMNIQQQLCVARWFSNTDGGKRALNLERLLADLEDKKRQEELNFWKDTVELRQKMLEKASEYAATRRRVSWFERLEGGDDVHLSGQQG